MLDPGSFEPLTLNFEPLNPEPWTLNPEPLGAVSCPAKPRRRRKRTARSRL